MLFRFFYIPFFFSFILAYEDCARSSAVEIETKEAQVLYQKVIKDYGAILEAYYKFAEAPTKEKDYCAKLVIASISSCVKDGSLPLYGNIFSRTWRTLGKQESHFVLKNFEALYIEDAIGHINKFLSNTKNITSIKLSHLLQNLRDIRKIVQLTLEYKLEEACIAQDTACGRVELLERELACERNRVKKLEKKLSLFC